jgi:hypothetical protein
MLIRYFGRKTGWRMPARLDISAAMQHIDAIDDKGLVSVTVW